LYDRALRIGEQIGSQTILAFALSNLADAYVEMGNAERALAIAVMAHERALPIGERRLVAASTMSLGSATFASGNHILGLDLMKKALGDRRDLGSAYPLTDDLCTFALALFDAERPIEGHAVALELQVLFETYPERIKQPTRLCWTLARDAQAMGEHERARTYVDRGRTFLKDDLVRINDADAEVSLRKLSFNRSLLDWPTPSRS
jgi:tetratricopeptide (TPR) repeat protein